MRRRAAPSLALSGCRAHALRALQCRYDLPERNKASIARHASSVDSLLSGRARDPALSFTPTSHTPRHPPCLSNDVSFECAPGCAFIVSNAPNTSRKKYVVLWVFLCFVLEAAERTQTRPGPASSPRRRLRTQRTRLRRPSGRFAVATKLREARRTTGAQPAHPRLARVRFPLQMSVKAKDALATQSTVCSSYGRRMSTRTPAMYVCRTTGARPAVLKLAPGTLSSRSIVLAMQIYGQSNRLENNSLQDNPWRAAGGCAPYLETASDFVCRESRA
ncbi:hypothetical protein DFH11DRAFT_234156 [Phellopilus nigrolimitatus]|nr:hypothetical protein DFH11DRAFT_234156 [Phellopilus nigrolimitatus]